MERKIKALEEEREELLREREFHREINGVLAHDLRSPIAVLSMAGYFLREELERISSAKTDEERTKAIKSMEDRIETVSSCGMNVSDLAQILNLTEITPEEINERREYFSFLEKIDEVMQAQAYQLSVRNQGISFEYSSEIEDLKLRTNTAIFKSIFSNVVSNAVRYAQTQSQINSIAYQDDGNFIFELENVVREPIDLSELRQIFDKGYRINGKDNSELHKRNEGLGLYFVNKVIRNGFGGNIEVSSDHEFQISKERVIGFESIFYGQKFQDFYTPLPSFHAKISIPLESII